jgi:C4-dicarboxylate transporter, DctM subunit
MIVGSIGIAIFLALVFLGLPIAMGLLLVSICGILYLNGFWQTLASSAPMFYNYIGKYEFSVVPMFVLMGQIGFHSGLLTEVFEVARKWFGRLPGGLAVAVVIAQAIFGACSGSTVAACVVIGKASIPVMRRTGYPPELYTGVVAGSGTLAALIPPSLIMCIYGLIVDQSIGKLLIGGILPGILSAIIFAGLIMYQGRHLPKDPVRYSFKEKILALRYLWVVIVLVLAIIGGIYGGIATPTEAGALGAFVIFLMGLITRGLSLSKIWESIRSTIVTCGMIMIIVVAAVLFAKFLTLSGFSHEMAGWVSAQTVPRIFIFLMVVGVYLILGCFVGAAGMMVMTLPMFYPLMINLGYDPIWFGIIVVILCEMAFLTPPVGVNLYATRSVAEDVPLNTIIRGIIPFLFRDLIVIAVLYMFPQIATILPSLM